MYKWSPDSWQRFPCEQPVDYPDANQLFNVMQELECLPPLVTRPEIISLKKALKKSSRQEAFILQGGDCAESFLDCHADVITQKLRVLLQMSLILASSANKPIIPIGRIAGQYTKPRSFDYETRGNVSLPIYRGDMVNSFSFDAESRITNPQRILQGYHYAATTLNFIRSTFRTRVTELNNRYASSSFQFSQFRPGYLYTSHEALNLYYEQALTRQLDGEWYNLSTHLPWIGMRTAKLGTAHVELLRGIKNPIGIKVGPDISPEYLAEIIKILNPNFEPDRLLLITRLGTALIEQRLPSLIEAVQATRCPVTWSCDPMHGNTIVTQEGIKTRHFDRIVLELKFAVEIHRAMNSSLNGVHLEMTGENVTECIGGSSGLTERDLKVFYKSLVDPRLNYEQSLEIAMELSKLLLKKEAVIYPVNLEASLTE